MKIWKIGGKSIPKLYHHSPFLFDKFDMSLASQTAIWGKGIYLSDSPRNLGGWKDQKGNGYIYEVDATTSTDKILNITEPLSNLDIDKVEFGIGRKLKEPIAPFLSIEKRFGTLTEFMIGMGYDILIHSPAAQSSAKYHYLCVNPSILRISNVYKGTGREIEK
jgi:hypothetical protein